MGLKDELLWVQKKRVKATYDACALHSLGFLSRLKIAHRVLACITLCESHQLQQAWAFSCCLLGSRAGQPLSHTNPRSGPSQCGLLTLLQFPSPSQGPHLSPAGGNIPLEFLPRLPHPPQCMRFLEPWRGQALESQKAGIRRVGPAPAIVSVLHSGLVSWRPCWARACQADLI